MIAKLKAEQCAFIKDSNLWISEESSQRFEEYQSCDGYKYSKESCEYDEYTDTYDGADYCDYDDVDWDSAKKRLTKTCFSLKKHKKVKKKKNKRTLHSLNIENLKSCMAEITKPTGNDNQTTAIPNVKMIHDEKKDDAPCVVDKAFDHKLQVRVTLNLNYDSCNNSKRNTWKCTGTASYKRFNYLLASLRIDIFDEYTQKNWDSFTFIPAKYDNDRLKIVNNASIPIFVKIKNNEFVQLSKRETCRDIDTCILHYIGQICLEARFNNLSNAEKNKQNQGYLQKMIENGIQWNIKRMVKNKNKDIIDYTSPVYHRKIRKLFEKYVPNIHMLVHIIFECLGYDRITTVTINGCCELKKITNDDFIGIAYNDGCIPRSMKSGNVQKLYENGIGYNVDESVFRCKNGQSKHYLNVGLDLASGNYGSHFHRHSPFQRKHSYVDKVWIPSQDPMQNILKK